MLSQGACLALQADWRDTFRNLLSACFSLTLQEATICIYWLADIWIGIFLSAHLSFVIFCLLQCHLTWTHRVAQFCLAILVCSWLPPFWQWIVSPLRSPLLRVLEKRFYSFSSPASSYLLSIARARAPTHTNMYGQGTWPAWFLLARSYIFIISESRSKLLYNSGCEI